MENRNKKLKIRGFEKGRMDERRREQGRKKRELKDNRKYKRRKKRWKEPK